VPTESFFNFFDPPKPPTDDEDDASSDIEERLELDYQLGEDIKEKLIPRAIDWFTGEALQYENLEDFDEGEFEDEDDEDEEDLSDDRDDDEESDEEVCSDTIVCYQQRLTRSRVMAQNQSRTQQSASKARRR
jgi:nucleosome assembly protein 1-like 1